MPTRRILAIASGGGHWAELCRLYPAFAELDVAFVSVHRNYKMRAHRFYVVRDFSRFDRWGLCMLLPQLARIILTERPDVVISTGAAPGLIALALAKILVRSKTIWIDTLSNVEKMSLSGLLARPISDVWLTQWPQLRTDRGPDYWGMVL